MAWNLGWMHNRVRMVVAMYLTKDLMLDWRLGERVCDLDLLVSRVLTIITRTVLFEDAYRL